jgi:uncharacterized protein
MERTGPAIGLGVWLALLFAAMVAVAAPAAAEPTASFDCTKARTATEQAICKDDSLAWLDLQLNRLYGDVRQLQSEGARPALRDEQRDWVARRDACGGTDECITRLYWQRVQSLARRIGSRGLTGQFSYAEKGMSGSLRLVEFPGNRAAGWIDTVNLVRLHICQVDMADLRVDGQSLTWNDPEEVDGKHCRVDLTVGPGGAVVTAQDCRNWCGMAGFFEGHYQR